VDLVAEFFKSNRMAHLSSGTVRSGHVANAGGNKWELARDNWALRHLHQQGCLACLGISSSGLLGDNSVNSGTIARVLWMASYASGRLEVVILLTTQSFRETFGRVS